MYNMNNMFVVCFQVSTNCESEALKSARWCSMDFIMSFRQYSDVTWASWLLKSPETQLFVDYFV